MSSGAGTTLVLCNHWPVGRRVGLVSLTEEAPEVKATHFWTLAVVISLLVPSALAAGGFEAARVTAQGESTLAGAAAAVFLLLDERGAAWDATAARALVERTSADTVVAQGLRPGGPALLRHEMGQATERTEHTDVVLTSSGGVDGGALLARAAGFVDAGAVSPSLLQIVPVEDPAFDQDDRADAAASGAGPKPVDTIHETLRGAFLLAEVEAGALTLTGDFTLDVFGADYTLSDADGARDERTGFRATGTGQERGERHRIHLEDATLRIAAPGIVQLALRDATLDVSGAFEATGPDGDALAVPDPSRLSLTAAGALMGIEARPPTLGVAGGVVARPGPSLLPVALTLAVLALLAGVALVALARRQRGDDLEMALVAMAERRWDDALPRLARVARRRPDDASIQLDRALCLEQLGRHELAAKAYEAALRHAPRNADAHFYYARTLAKMRERDAARVHLEAALEYDPRLVEMTRGEPLLRGL